MADDKPEEQEQSQDSLVKKDAKTMREESAQQAPAKKRKKRRRNRQLDIPDHTRFTFLLFPPYGIAWLLTNKQLDGEMRKFGMITMTVILVVWAVPISLLAYAGAILEWW